ncbi:hypothetical protein ANCCAN_01994 [Ancylostoma caninum]|uniref:Uncharacterized protein n=1 Tax=Ancylostoma caninum TaxID=29170 RepID=A0A368H5N3_ANCCA|nr:hypothetical protein ANCCAN_01994 [Ancylostoma caninum]
MTLPLKIHIQNSVLLMRTSASWRFWTQQDRRSSARCESSTCDPAVDF